MITKLNSDLTTTITLNPAEIDVISAALVNTIQMCKAEDYEIEAERAEIVFSGINHAQVELFRSDKKHARDWFYSNLTERAQANLEFNQILEDLEEEEEKEWL